jgi:ketosteroid isomerase-like protein
MGQDFIQFVESMDRSWIDGRFEDLKDFLAPDIVMVGRGGVQRIAGQKAAIQSYREFMARSQVVRFDSSNYTVTERGAAAIVEYDWEMVWKEGGTEHEAKGFEILVLAQRDGAWRIVWRTQLPG